MFIGCFLRRILQLELQNLKGLRTLVRGLSLSRWMIYVNVFIRGNWGSETLDVPTMLYFFTSIRWFDIFIFKGPMNERVRENFSSQLIYRHFTSAFSLSKLTKSIATT